MITTTYTGRYLRQIFTSDEGDMRTAAYYESRGLAPTAFSAAWITSRREWADNARASDEWLRGRRALDMARERRTREARMG